jgi:hypothetical protein
VLPDAERLALGRDPLLAAIARSTDDDRPGRRRRGEDVVTSESADSAVYGDHTLDDELCVVGDRERVGATRLVVKDLDVRRVRDRVVVSAART